MKSKEEIEKRAEERFPDPEYSFQERETACSCLPRLSAQRQCNMQTEQYYNKVQPRHINQY